MKKIFAIILVAIVVLSIASCSASPLSKFVGTWESDGGIIYTIKKDGTATQTTLGLEIPISINVEEDSITISGVKYDYEFDGDTVTLSYNISGMTAHQETWTRSE